MTDTAAEPQQLTTTEVADVVGIDCHTLSAAVTKLWWSYLEGQDAQIGAGRRRAYAPVDVVVIDMLVSTGELGGDLVNLVREEFAERIYDAWRDRTAGDGSVLPELLRFPTGVADRIEVWFRPSWFLVERAATVAEEAARG